MKIMFNCLTMEKGGAERVITVLANYFSKNNEVTVLTLKRSDDAYTLNSTVKRVRIDKTNYKNDNIVRRKTRKLSLVRLSGLKKAIVAENPDIIISFLPEPSIRLMLIKRFSSRIRKIPTIISIRTDPNMEYRNPIIKTIVKKLYRNVDGMVYQTEDAKQYFRDIIKTKNQEIIQNPIDVDALEKPKCDNERRDVIIAVGRLERAKNQELLIRAFNKIAEEKRRNYTIEIYGEGTNRQYLEDLIHELGLEKAISLKGQVDDVPRWLNQSKIYTFCSQYEGLPNALIEAMAMGLPCIATDCPCGGPRSLIKNNKNGILVKNGDVEAYSRALNELMQSGAKRERLAKNALSIRKTNCIDTIAGRWQDLMVNIMEKKNEITE